MRINPVLRNESKLAVRTPRFTLMIFLFIAVLSIGSIIYYKYFNDLVFAEGLNLKSSIWLYMGMAIGQAILLMFIVPSLTATAICSEREKQTLDILLSSKLTPIQIIIGKLTSSSLKVIMLVVCTMPLYALCGLMGGVRLSNIAELIIYFIINTFFVGSIGVLISTYVKTSKAATAITYAIVLLIYIGILVLIWALTIISAVKQSNGVPQLAPIAYLSPVIGFISMLTNQIGVGRDFAYLTASIGLKENVQYISVGFQLVITALCIYLAAAKLNPLKKRRRRK